MARDALDGLLLSLADEQSGEVLTVETLRAAQRRLAVNSLPYDGSISPELQQAMDEAEAQGAWSGYAISLMMQGDMLLDTYAKSMGLKNYVRIGDSLFGERDD